MKLDYQIAKQNHETDIISSVLNTVNVSQTLLSQQSTTGPILTRSNIKLRLIIKDGKKIAYYRK